jgi:dihydrofolate reductase
VGSGNLIGTLPGHDLLDEYRLVVYPIALGTGKTLFPAGFPLSRFSLLESRSLPAGVLANTYRPANAG